MINLNITISTVERPNKSPYLDRCLKSIRQDYDGDIYLIIGGDPSYARKYASDKRYIPLFVGEQEKKFPTNIQKAGLGYYTGLTLDRNTPLLILEDDAVLKPGWYKELQERISFVPPEIDKYVLSLITPSGAIVPKYDIDIPSIQKFHDRHELEYIPGAPAPICHIITYSNTTGMYYPASILQTRLPEYIYKFSVEGDAVYDLALGNYMFRYGLPIYITIPNLLQNADVLDTHLGHIKKKATVDYSQWDYTK